MNLPEFDIVKELADAWADENRENLEYHLHPLGEEGMSDKGHCSWQLAWRASGRPVPKKEGERAFTGAMDVGRMHHAEVQRKLVPRLKKKYPGLFVGPIIGDNGEPEEINVWVKMFDGVIAYSPLDLCIATAPGFVKVKHQYRNKVLEVWELAPGAKILKAWDIKSANAGSFYYKQKEDMSYDHEAQFTGYMAAAGIDQLPALYVNKDDGRSFVKICQWDSKRWETLIAKRKREKALTEELRDPAAKPKVCEQDFYWYNPEMKGLCLYCAHAKVREQLTQKQQSYAKPRFELVGPCVDALRAQNQTLDAIMDVEDDLYEDKPAIVLPPPDFTDEENLDNIEKTLNGRKCIHCGEPCDPKSKYFCAKHGPKIEDTVGL